MDFRHLIVTCLFSKLRLPFDNQKVKENYAIFLKTAGDDAYELKKSLRNLIQKDSDPQLVKFVNSIDSVPEVETA